MDQISGPGSRCLKVRKILIDAEAIVEAFFIISSVINNKIGELLNNLV
jgi:hypothetical protein